MKKWIGPVFSLLSVVAFLAFSGLAPGSDRPKTYDPRGHESRLLLTQGGEREEGDSHGNQLLRRVQEILDGWLKSLNERIENEDVTRLEVRFLEILRSILEWVKEKVDASLESSQEQRREKKQRGLFRDI
jgi:hypothetical protein